MSSIELTVKIPLKCSSSSTTKTQSLLLAAINWAASITSILSLTVKACAGRRADTVPAIFLVCLIRVELPLFFDNSCSIFLRIAYKVIYINRVISFFFFFFFTSSFLDCLCLLETDSMSDSVDVG